MKESPEARPGERRRSDTAVLMFAWIGPPAIWFAYLNVQYPLAYFACVTGATWPLHVMVVLALAGTISGGLAALKRWRRPGALRKWSRPESAAEDAGGAEVERRRFVASMAVALSALFTALVVMQWLPTVLFHPCQL